MANQEIVFNDPASDSAWVVTVDENGKQIKQDPPGVIPPNAYGTVKGGGGVNPLQMTYGQFKSDDNDMSILSADGTESTGTYQPGADPVEDLAFIASQLESNEGVNGGSNSSYGPNGIYDPAKPVKVDVAGDLVTGAEGRPISVNSVKSIPQGELTAVGIYGAPGLNIQELSREAAVAISRNDNVTPQQINGVYGNAVRYAAAKDISVQAALRDMISMGMAGGGGDGGGSGGGGGGGPFATTNTTITQTDELEAERILNTALSTYLGRRADEDEVAEFMASLNKNEKFNPTVTKTTGVRSGNNTTQQSTQTGGFDSAGFAERWSRSREGAAEYQAATTYMDAFQSVIDGMEY